MANLELTFARGEDSLLVRSFSISERIAELFCISIMARSPNPSIAMEPIVGRPVTLRMDATDKIAALGGVRQWKGICNAFEQVQAEPFGHSTYRLEIVPTLWLLTQRSDFRIFQYLNVPDIIDRVLSRYRIDVEWRIDRHDYPRMEYKTQYGETDYAFFCRLLETAGLTFLLPQDADGGLVITDHPQSADLRAGPPVSYSDNPKSDGDIELLTKVEFARQIRPGAFLFQGQDFRQPDLHPKGAAPKAATLESPFEHTTYQPGAFLIEYPGRFRYTPFADDRGVVRYDPEQGKRQARVALEALRADLWIAEFSSNTIDFWPGMIFTVQDHPHERLGAGKRWLVASFSCEGRVEERWNVRASAVPADMAYRPVQKTRRPFVRGVQTATVVGWEGDDIHTDEYGRARVLFPWDRSGRTDAQSSCWARVSEGWAGAGFGLFTLPRVGQEVLVAFVDGDPDQPMIVGRMHNRLQPVPYPLPEYKTRSMLKGDTSPGSTGYSEITLEDTKGDEMVYFHAERHLRTLVKHDEIISVLNNRDKNVLLNEIDTTLHNRTEVTIGHREETTGAHRTTVVAKNSAKLVKGDEDERAETEHVVWVGKDLHVATHESKHELVEIDHHTTVRNDRRDQVDQDLSLGVGIDYFTKVGANYAAESGNETHLASSSNVVGEAPDVTMRGPGGFLRIDATGVVIAGTLVRINDSGSAAEGLGGKLTAAAASKEAKKGTPCPPQDPNINTTYGPKDTGEGGYDWQVSFELPRPACSQGWIVQEILAVFLVEDDAGNTLISMTAHYWEAWKVRKKKTVTTYLEADPNDFDDQYLTPSRPLTTGKITVRGLARFYEGALPKDFKAGSIAMAGGLHATTKKPAFWDSKGTVHDITSIWNATVDPESTDVSAKAGADELKGTN